MFSVRYSVVYPLIFLQTYSFAHWRPSFCAKKATTFFFLVCNVFPRRGSLQPRLFEVFLDNIPRNTLKMTQTADVASLPSFNLFYRKTIPTRFAIPAKGRWGNNLIFRPIAVKKQGNSKSDQLTSWHEDDGSNLNVVKKGLQWDVIEKLFGDARGHCRGFLEKAGTAYMLAKVCYWMVLRHAEWQKKGTHANGDHNGRENVAELLSIIS